MQTFILMRNTSKRDLIGVVKFLVSFFGILEAVKIFNITLFQPDKILSIIMRYVLTRIEY